MLEQNRKRKLTLSDSIESGSRYYTHFPENKKRVIEQTNPMIETNNEELTEFLFHLSSKFENENQKLEYFSLFTSRLSPRVVPFYLQPTKDEEYKEWLPKRNDRSLFDNFVERIFFQNPILFKMLQISAHNAKSFCALISVVKSLLANFVSHFSSQLEQDPQKLPNLHIAMKLVQTLQLVNIKTHFLFFFQTFAKLDRLSVFQTLSEELTKCYPT